MNRLACVITAVLVFGGGGSSAAQHTSGRDSAAVARQLDSVYARMSRAYRYSDAAAVARLYHDRAFYLAPERPLLRGQADVEKVFAGLLGSTPRSEPTGPRISFEIIDRRISGDLAYDIGQYQFGTSPPSGKFIVVWRRGADGRWLFWADGYNTLRPRVPDTASFSSPRR